MSGSVKGFMSIRDAGRVTPTARRDGGNLISISLVAGDTDERGNEHSENELRDQGCTHVAPCAPRKRQPYHRTKMSDIRLMIDLHEQGLPPHRIALYIGCTRMTVRQHLIRQGKYAPRSAGRPSIDDEISMDVAAQKRLAGGRKVKEGAPG